MTDTERAIHNERVKYAAAALDRLSTGCYLVGGMTPTIQVTLTYSGDGAFDYGRFWMTWAVFVVSILVGLYLHGLGYQTLRDIK